MLTWDRGLRSKHADTESVDHREHMAADQLSAEICKIEETEVLEQPSVSLWLGRNDSTLKVLLFEPAWLCCLCLGSDPLLSS